MWFYYAISAICRRNSFGAGVRSASVVSAAINDQLWLPASGNSTLNKYATEKAFPNATYILIGMPFAHSITTSFVRLLYYAQLIDIWWYYLHGYIRMRTDLWRFIVCIYFYLVFNGWLGTDVVPEKFQLHSNEYRKLYGGCRSQIGSIPITNILFALPGFYNYWFNLSLPLRQWLIIYLLSVISEWRV